MKRIYMVILFNDSGLVYFIWHNPVFQTIFFFFQDENVYLPEIKAIFPAFPFLVKTDNYNQCNRFVCGSMA